MAGKRAMNLGGGGRFAKIKAAARESGARDPDAVAAAHGIKRYGKERMTEMAVAGRKRAVRRRGR